MGIRGALAEKGPKQSGFPKRPHALGKERAFETERKEYAEKLRTS